MTIIPAVRIQNDQTEINLMCDKYVRTLTSLCGNDIPRVPEGYLLTATPLGDRMWDYYMIQKYGDLQLDDIVLEVGALHTFDALYWQTLVKQVVVTDNFQWAHREYARDYMTPSEWCTYLMQKSSKIRAEHADIMAFPYPADTFDKLISVSTHEHVIDDRRGLLECARVLKPGGTLLMTIEFNHETAMAYSSEAMLRIYNPTTLGDLIEGFELEVLLAKEPQDVVQQARPFPLTAAFLKLRK